MAAEDCKPNKSLRTTIKVFLRTEEKKREVLRNKAAKDTPPATPTVVEAPAAVSVVAEESLEVPAQENDIPAAAANEPVVGVSVDGEAAPEERSTADDHGPTEAEKDVPQQSIEVGLKQMGS